MHTNDEFHDEGLGRKVFKFLIGPIGAVAGVALFAFLFLFLIPNLLHSGDGRWDHVSRDGISIYYEEGAPPEVKPSEILGHAAEQRDMITKRLHLKTQNLPDPIRIYVHRSPGSLRREIASRKGNTTKDVPLGLIDLGDTSELTPLMVRLFTTFAWGEPSSKFLRQGTQYYFTAGAKSNIYKTAGLGDLFFSLKEVLTLEQTDSYPVAYYSELYDEFDSPNAPAALSLSGLSKLMASKKGKCQYFPYIKTEATSFVSFLLEIYGPEQLRGLWLSHSLSRGVRDVFGTNLKKMEAEWLSFVRELSNDNNAADYFSIFYSLLQGDLDRGLALSDQVEDLGTYSVRASFTRAKILFFQGATRDSMSTLGAVTTEELTGVLSEEASFWRDLFRSHLNGSRHKLGRVTIFIPNSKHLSQGEIDSIRNTVQRVGNLIGTSSSKERKFQLVLLPENLSIPNDDFTIPRTAAFASTADELSVSLAETVANTLSKTPTYSSLLSLGLIIYLSDSNLRTKGLKMVEKEKWKSLGSLVLDSSADRDDLVEAGAFVQFLIEKYGPKCFFEIWSRTTPLGGDRSLKGTLIELTGESLESIEEELLATIQTG